MFGISTQLTREILIRVIALVSELVTKYRWSVCFWGDI
jgi:hypothetical protein